MKNHRLESIRLYVHSMLIVYRLNNHCISKTYFENNVFLLEKVCSMKFLRLLVYTHELPTFNILIQIESDSEMAWYDNSLCYCNYIIELGN